MCHLHVRCRRRWMIVQDVQTHESQVILGKSQVFESRYYTNIYLRWCVQPVTFLAVLKLLELPRIHQVFENSNLNIYGFKWSPWWQSLLSLYSIPKSWGNMFMSFHEFSFTLAQLYNINSWNFIVSLSLMITPNLNSSWNKSIMISSPAENKLARLISVAEELKWFFLRAHFLSLFYGSSGRQMSSSWSQWTAGFSDVLSENCLTEVELVTKKKSYTSKDRSWQKTEDCATEDRKELSLLQIKCINCRSPIIFIMMVSLDCRPVTQCSCFQNRAATFDISFRAWLPLLSCALPFGFSHLSFILSIDLSLFVFVNLSHRHDEALPIQQLQQWGRIHKKQPNKTKQCKTKQSINQTNKTNKQKEPTLPVKQVFVSIKKARTDLQEIPPFWLQLKFKAQIMWTMIQVHLMMIQVHLMMVQVYLKQATAKAKARPRSEMEAHGFSYLSSSVITNHFDDFK